METKVYDHYIAVDWSIKNMAIARMTTKSNKITVADVPSDVVELQIYLKSLKGTRILAIEETTTSQWLYTELRDYVDRILICDPSRNRLLSEGAKTDKIDASKLVQLLRANLLKEVFHSSDRFLDLRRLVSGYQDLVYAGVRLKNQRYSLLRACGLTGQEGSGIELKNSGDQLVLDGVERRIASHDKEKEVYVWEAGKETSRDSPPGKFTGHRFDRCRQDCFPGGFPAEICLCRSFFKLRGAGEAGEAERDGFLWAEELPLLPGVEIGIQDSGDHRHWREQSDERLL